MNLDKIVAYTKQDDYQLEQLIHLVLQRNKGVFRDELFNAYQQVGIFHAQSIDHFEQVLVGMGTHPEDLGLAPTKVLDGGYFIPCLDHLGEILYFINYSWERGPKNKYYIVYPSTEYRKNLTQIKVMGLEDTKQALDEGVLYVTEGTFDRLRLKAYGLPVVSTLGTKFTHYFERYAQRFNQVIYIGDRDDAGSRAYLNARERNVRMLKQLVPKGKDVDEFASAYPEEFKEWLDVLTQKA